MSRKKSENRYDGLVIKSGESRVAHRSFILWCMCKDGKRSVRSVARSVSRSEATVREYKNRWSWFDRIADVDVLSARAERVYRNDYYAKHKMGEMVQIADRLDVPFIPDLPMSASITGDIADIAGYNKPDEEGSPKSKSKRQQVMLVDEALNLIHRRIQSGEIKASIRDIPLLLDLRDRLDGVVHGGLSSTLSVESMRVRVAREQGGNIVEAMYQDAQEMVSILGTLSQSAEGVVKVSGSAKENT